MLTASIFSLYAVGLLYNFIKYGFKMWKIPFHTDGGTEFMIHDKYLFSLVSFLRFLLFSFFKKSPETVAVKRNLFSVFNEMKICRKPHL